MTYAHIKRTYQNTLGKQSFTLADLLYDYDTVTIKRGFSCGGDQGTWHDTPFNEVTTITAGIEPEIRTLCNTQVERNIPYSQDVLTQLFDMVTNSIEQSWDANRFHVVFSSSGHDSRIIASAIKRLIAKHGQTWLGKGLLFLSNRWEASPFEVIMQQQGWSDDQFFAYTSGHDNDHFRPALNLDTAWQAVNAPCPIPGNLWHYLIEIAKINGKIPYDAQLQGYDGYWANELWNSFTLPSVDWIHRVETWYGYNVMSALPQLDTMEHPLVDIEIAKILMQLKNVSGDALRKELAFFVSPETKDIARLPLSDCEHLLGLPLRGDIDRLYNTTWYANNVSHWQVPTHSGFSNEWAKWSLASLCEHLLKRGIKIKVA